MTRTEMTVSELDALADRAAPLDALLVDAALGPVRRLAPNSSTLRFAAWLARHPVATGRRLGSLAAELGRVGVGTSTIAPSRRDRRFADPAWSQNPLLNRAVQGYLAAIDTAGGNLARGSSVRRTPSRAAGGRTSWPGSASSASPTTASSGTAARR
jgi:hypothetical protein